MANNWYISSAGYTAVAQFAISHAYNVGDIVRQLAAPSVGNERCFRCTSAGTSGGSESAWTLTKGATTTQGGATFTEITGQETYQGTSWAAPHARIPNAYASGWGAAGDTFFVGSDHAETSGAATLINPPGTLASPNKTVCVARPSATIPPTTADLATTASVSTTGAFNISIGTTGVNLSYFYGITFSAGSSSSSASIILGSSASCPVITLEQCTLQLNNTSTSSLITPGTGSNGSISTLVLRNTNIAFGNASQCIKSNAMAIQWTGGSLLGTAPNTLFSSYPGSSRTGPHEIRNVDLSLMGAAQNIVTQPGASFTTGLSCTWQFVNCKLNAALGGVSTGTIDTPGHGDIDLITSDASTTAREEHYRYAGTVIADTANYLTAGATDGTTHKSWKIATNSSATFATPLDCPNIYQWVTTTGTKTITMYISNISGTTLKDIDIGIEAEYLGQGGGVPLGTLGSSLGNPISAGTNLTTDTSPWSGQGGLTKQKITLTVTINEPGFIRIRLRCTRASVTIWADPLPVIA